MSSTQHQLIEQCATRLRGIVEALDNIHDNTPHRWSTELDDVHSSAESLLALIKDQAPARSEASFEEWLANELEGEDGQPVPAAVCDIALARRAFNHWPKLEHPAKVGGVRFSAGVSSRLVVEAAQRLNEFESTPEQEAERPEMSPERAAYFMRRFKSEEKLLGPNEQAAVDYVLSLLAQHESIVGALRAELESERNRVNIYVNNNGIRQDNERLRAELRAALARVAEQQTEIEWLKNPKALAETVHADAQEAVKLQRLLMDSHTACRPAGEGLMGWAHAALSAQAQHSVPEGWKPVPIEPLLNMMSDKDHDTRIMAERQLLSILAAAPGNSVPQAWLDVQAERRRQITAEGWTPEHDDEHDNGELAAAGAAYALHAADHLNPYSQGDGGDEAPSCWPWHDGIAGRGEGPEKTEPAWWKPSTPRRDLVKACALALAEIERLDRAGISQSPQPGATTASS
ncbi:hypothetical protein ACM6SP_001106 [Pseudomonas aeruginosa]